MLNAARGLEASKMDFKFGVHGFAGSELTNASGVVLDGLIALNKMKFQDNFVEFSAEGFWDGLTVVNRVAENLIAIYPDRFDPNKTKIWVNGEPLDLFLLGKVYAAEQAMRSASLLLRQGRSKEPKKSNEKSRRARLLLEKTLKDFLS